MLFEIKPDQCVACLSCVRVCPVAAVAVDDTHIEIVDDSCIRCGACVPACPHEAIGVRGELTSALDLAVAGNAILILGVESEVHFYPHTPEQVVNACYSAGFGVVYRGVVGDELVAEEYRKLWDRSNGGTMIRSTCPIVVDTVRSRYPDLMQYLAPVTTPVRAEAAYARYQHGSDARIIYAGVCLTEGGEDVDATITLQELEELFRACGVDVADEPLFFDRIPGERRRHLSMAGGMPYSVLSEERHSSMRFRKMRGLNQLDAIAHAVTVDKIELGFVDLLPCEGCLDHPLIGPPDELFRRRKILQATEPSRSATPVVEPEVHIDISAAFEPIQRNGTPPGREDLEDVLEQIGTTPDGSAWDCGACGFDKCARFAEAYLKGRATLRQCPPYQEVRAFEAQREAAVDELTGLATYRVLRDRVRQEVARSRRAGEPFAVLFADLDNFKRVNDSLGHESGNLVLARVAEVLLHAVRTTDVAARYGGDEFVILLIATDVEGGRKVGEQVRRAVESLGRDLDIGEVAMTISVGTAQFDPNGDDGEVLEAADRALYVAKQAGGNRVV